MPDAPPPRPAVPPALVELLREAAATEDVAAGTVLFRRGDPADAALIVESGHVEVHVGDGEPPKRLGTGALLGELALLSPDGRRTATVVAGDDCRLARVGRAEFESILQRRPDLAARALHAACSYLVESERRLVESLERRNAELARYADYLKRTREELDATELAALTDTLTDLYNRRCLDRQLPRLLEQERESPRGLAVLLIDLDKFKPINDTHGHAAGDAVLRAVAAVLRRFIRGTDLAFRLGGDEFVVILAPLVPTAGFDPPGAASRLRHAIATAEVHVPEGVLGVGATIGVTEYRAGDDPEAILARADAYLYQAKAAGRNVVCFDGALVR